MVAERETNEDAERMDISLAETSGETCRFHSGFTKTYTLACRSRLRLVRIKRPKGYLKLNRNALIGIRLRILRLFRNLAS